MNVFVRECGRRAVLVARGIAAGKWRKAAVVGAAVLSIGLASSATADAGWLRYWHTVPPGNEFWVPPGDDYVRVTTGGGPVALRADGSLVAWNPYSHRVWAPVEGNDFVALAPATGAYGVALRRDGSLAGWGYDHGQEHVPAGNDFVAAAVGNQFGIALKADGSLLAWGNNGSGQCNVPAGNDFVAVAAGYQHSVALKADGSLVAWGMDDEGIIDVPPGNDYAQIVAMMWHTVAIRNDGSLAAWGNIRQPEFLDVPAGNDFVAIASGGDNRFDVALRSDGSLAVWAWGEPLYVPEGGRFVSAATKDFVVLAVEVPEPSALLLAASGLTLGLLGALWRGIAWRHAS